MSKIASGEVVATFAYAEGTAGWTDGAVKATLSGGKLTGTKSPVADGGVASLAVVLTDEGGKPGLALVSLDQPGVTRTRLASFDQLRAHYTLAFDAACSFDIACSNAVVIVESVCVAAA